MQIPQLVQTVINRAKLVLMVIRMQIVQSVIKDTVSMKTINE